MEKNLSGTKDLQVCYAKTTGAYKGEYSPRRKETTGNVLDMTRRLKALVQQETMHTSMGHQTGTFDTRALTKLATNNTTVFKQKDLKTEGGVAVYILLDASGSMGGSTDAVAEMAYVLGKALQNNGVKVKVAYHRTSGLARGSTLLMSMKDWDETKFEGLNAYNADCDNRDDVAVYLAGMELAMRTEEKKLLVVFSDGQPSDTTSRNYSGRKNELRGTDGVKYCGNAVRRLRSSGIRTVGVYLCHASTNQMLRAKEEGHDYTEVFKQIYGDDFMVCPMFELGMFPAKLTRAVAPIFRR